MAVQHGSLRRRGPGPHVDIKGSFYANKNDYYFQVIIHQLKHTYEYYIKFLPVILFYFM